MSFFAAIDHLAGTWSPALPSSERFRGFVQQYFRNGLAGVAEELWQLRNQLAHAFAPGACELLVHQGALHLTRRNSRLLLNAEDCFGELALASNRYFSDLLTQPALRANFRRRLSAASAAAPLGHIL